MPIVLLNFDQHWVSSPPGPIAAQDWFVEKPAPGPGARAPHKKIVVGVCQTSAYDWPQAREQKMVLGHGVQACKKRCCTPMNPKPTSISMTPL